jgi:hypothetical protein
MYLPTQNDIFKRNQRLSTKQNVVDSSKQSFQKEKAKFQKIKDKKKTWRFDEHSPIGETLSRCLLKARLARKF